MPAPLPNTLKRKVEPVNTPSTTRPPSWQGILLGTLIGAFLGAAIGWVYTSSTDSSTRAVNPIKPFDYFKLGITVLAAARSIGEFVERA